MPIQRPMQTPSPQGHQLPPPGMRHGAHGLSPPKGSATTKPSNQLHREQETVPNTSRPPTAPHHGQASGCQHHRGVLPGPSLPFNRRGNPKRRELQRRVQTRSRIRLHVITEGLLLPRAHCSLAWGTALTAHPIITFPPSKKTFHKPPRDGGNSERPRTSGAAPTATRRCPGSAAAAPARSRPGHRPT